MSVQTVPTTSSAKIIADSISPQGHRLTTMEVTMHRFVLAEFNTHRMFSRNSASSRAIPIEKRLRLQQDPAMPIYWGRNQPGMQAGEELEGRERDSAINVWLKAWDNAIQAATFLSSLGVHKQITNRLLEPFLWHVVVVSATEWENFFAQRCSPLAQPEMRAVAEAMREALAGSKPLRVKENSWHLPYVQPKEREDLEFDQLKMLSVARCARVSYLTQDGVRDLEKDYELYNRLAGAKPPHASPFEHVARAVWPIEQGNFKGWWQLRHQLGM